MHRYKCCCIIFSKNNPLRLHAVLESLINVIGLDSQDVFVVFKTTNLDFERQYEKVKFKFEKFIFIEETVFKSDFLSIVANPYYSHVLLSNDKNIFIDNVSVDHVMNIVDNHRSVIGFSLCSDVYINQDVIIDTYIDSEVVIVNWKEEMSVFGSPLGISSSVYRTSLVKKLCQQLVYHNLKTFVIKFDAYKTDILQMFPWILSFKKRKCITFNMNSVKNDLLLTYQNGKKLDILSISDDEKPYIFIKQ